MRLTILVSSFFILLNDLCGQANLVPNPSFEYYSSCPINPGDILMAEPWVDPTLATSDYFNICNGSVVGVPTTLGGNQDAHTGVGYAGFDTYITPGSYREYVQVKLNDTLIIGKRYCVNFYVSLSDTEQYAVDRIGAYISTNAITCGPPGFGCILNYIPQIENPVFNILANDSGWSKISGSFIASGGELYLTIGNFYDNSNTNLAIVHSSSPYSASYYYIDDVSLVEIAPCISGQSVSICPLDSIQLGTSAVTEVNYSWLPAAGLSDANISNPIAHPSVTTTYTLTQTQCDVISTATVTITVRDDCNIPPTLVIPTTLKSDQMFIIQGLEPNSKLEIFDMWGRKVFVSENYQNDFGGYDIAAGIYVVRFTKADGEMVKQKLCVVK